MSRPSFLDRHRFLILLVTLAVLLTAYPVFESGGRWTVVFQASFQLVVIAGLLAQHSERRWVLSGWALVFPSVSTFWMPLIAPDSAFWNSARVQGLGNLTMALYLLLLVVVILRDLFSSQEVTNDRLCGSLCAYLLLGLAFGFLYTSVQTHLPGSFAGAGTDIALEGLANQQRSSELFYFSFVTLTTLGYGDIAPSGSVARMLVMWEAVLGQGYLTILVARLVGLHLSSSRK